MDPLREIAFERWVEVASTLLGRDGEARDAVLDALAVDAEAWDHADSTWHTQLARDVARGDLTRAKRYASACREELARRANEQESAIPRRSVDSRKPESGDLTERTLPLLRLDLGLERSMPFVKTTTDAAVRAAPKVTSSATSGSDGETIVPELLRLGLPVTPFEPTTTVMESVEAYAALCVEIERAPNDRLDVYARFGIGSGRDAEALNRRWRERFQSDVELKKKWDEFLQKRRAARG